jgi:hypothetical protein
LVRAICIERVAGDTYFGLRIPLAVFALLVCGMVILKVAPPRAVEIGVVIGVTVGARPVWGKEELYPPEQAARMVVTIQMAMKRRVITK